MLSDSVLEKAAKTLSDRSDELKALRDKIDEDITMLTEYAAECERSIEALDIARDAMSEFV